MTVFDILNNAFDKIYVISLERSTKRHPVLKERLDGLNYDIFWGVDGKKLDVENLVQNGIYDPEGARDVQKSLNLEPQGLSKSVLGCALSHIGIYKDVLKNGYEKVLIFEDDIRVDQNKEESLQKSLDELPSDWELLYLGYLYNNSERSFGINLRIKIVYPLLYALGYKRYDPHHYRCKFPRPYSDHLQLAGFHYGAHAYGVTLKGVKKILEMQTPIVMEADNAISELCQREKLKAFRVKDRVFNQDRHQFESQISKDN